MRYFLSEHMVLKWLESPSVYHIKTDELYELDDESFEFLKNCASETGCEAGAGAFIDYCMTEGILTKDNVPAKRPAPVKSPEPSLRYLELQITDKCNLKCRHCYIKKSVFSDLPVNVIKSVLREFEDMQGLRVLITGGEPLIHRNFKDVNRILPEFNIRKVFFTNGSFLSKEILKELNVDEIQVSIDGLEDSHDSLRGRGAFRSALDAIDRALACGIEVSVATMIHPRNLCDFDTMERMFRDMGVKDWTVDVPCVQGRLIHNAEFQISPEQAGKYLSYGYGGGLHAGSVDFACGLHLLAVMADGRVAKCTFYADSPVGRIQEGLRKCWERITPIRLSQLTCDCRHIESCRGGCRYRAALLGDPMGKDLYRCALYDILEPEKRDT